MKTHRKRTLSLTIMLIFVMACRLYSCDGPSTIVTLDKQLISCQGYTDDKFNGGSTCTFSCPDGSKVSTDVPEGSVSGQFISFSLEYLQQQYCPASPLPTEEPTQEPTDVPTDAPTEEATEAPTEPPLQPYLTGSATICDLTNRYVNFSIDPNASSEVFPSIFFNGESANCSVSTSNANTNVLTCILPLDAAFPLTVSARTGEREINNFTFDGAICVYSDPVPPVTDEDPLPPTDPCAGVLTPTPSCP